jgi:hypothetical protein
MSETPMDELGRLLRDEYNSPPETPREEMWAAIESALEPRSPGVVSLEEERRRRWVLPRRPFAWAAAAAVVLAAGVGIGRWTAPAVAPVAEAPAAGPAATDASVLRVAALEHLGRTESLLRMVRSDGASGRVDPAVGGWARGLLTQTRLLLDVPQDQDPALRELLEDLELVLVQIAALSGTDGQDAERSREELKLALDGLERREVLSRIQAVVPPGAGLSGT